MVLQSSPTSAEASASPSPAPSSVGNNAPKFGTLVPNRVFVGGISANTTEQDLLELFSKYGTVKATKVISDRAGVSKGYGFVTFETEDEARRLTQEADNIMLKDRKLNIAPAIKKQVNDIGYIKAYSPRLVESGGGGMVGAGGTVYFGNAAAAYSYANHQVPVLAAASASDYQQAAAAAAAAAAAQSPTFPQPSPSASNSSAAAAAVAASAASAQHQVPQSHLSVSAAGAAAAAAAGYPGLMYHPQAVYFPQQYQQYQQYQPQTIQPQWAAAAAAAAAAAPQWRWLSPTSYTQQPGSAAASAASAAGYITSDGIYAQATQPTYIVPDRSY